MICGFVNVYSTTMLSDESRLFFVLTTSYGHRKRPIWVERQDIDRVRAIVAARDLFHAGHTTRSYAVH